MEKIINNTDKNSINTKHMVRTALFMAILTLGSKLLGFVREMVLAGCFGTSYIVDSYVMSLTILSVLFGGIISSISTAYMPMFSKVSEENGEKAGNGFTTQIIKLLLVITVVIAIIGILFSKQIVILFASGFSGETAKLTSFFVKILFSYIIFSSVASILESYLQYKNIFLPQIVSGYSISICIILCIIISYYTSYYYLAFGTLIGYIVRFLVLYIISKKNGFYKINTKNEKGYVSELIKLAVPVFIGSYITYINLFVDKSLASRLTEGSIASLNYASLLNSMIINMTITILSTILYPRMAQANALNQTDKFNEIVCRGFNIVWIIAIPCSLGAIIYSNQIIQIVYERGAFDTVATNMTESAFMYYAMGMLFIAINEFVVKIYYSMRDMKDPMICGAIGVIINIVLNLILVGYMQHRGLALATSIAALCNAVLLITRMKKLKYGIRIIESKIKLIKVAFMALIAIGISFLCYNIIIYYFNEYIYMRVIQMLITVIVAIICYLFMLKRAKIEEIEMLWKSMKLRKIKNTNRGEEL